MTDGAGRRAADARTEDLAELVVARVGALVATGRGLAPYRLLDPSGAEVCAVGSYLGELAACGRSGATQRSYGVALLRWFRFCWAAGVDWERASQREARDFCRWLALVARPGRPRRAAGDPAPPAGVAPPGTGYAVSVRAHAETVCRRFYDFHRDAGTGPVLNPFPLAEHRTGRAHAHHNPMQPYPDERAGRYRPRLPARVPRAVPDAVFDQVFAELGSHRDRALVAFYVSTGARASELLSATQGGVDPGRGVITVVRKGSRARQELPASSDAFVWLRLYQLEAEGLVPTGATLPLWWTRRAPVRALRYHGAHRMFTRAVARAGAAVTLHALRHTAAYRMAEDPALPLSDVQWVLGHARLGTTQLYLTPRSEDVVRRLLAHHAEVARRAAGQAGPPPPAAGYRPESLAALFGPGRS
jgi:integrase